MNLFKHLVPNPSHYYLIVFTMLEVGMVEALDLNDSWKPMYNM